MYRQLEHYRVSPEFETLPTEAFACPTELEGAEAQASPSAKSEVQGDGLEASASPANAPKVPKLLRTYLTIGARIGGPPAWDREFGTIDFLTLLDLKMVSASARNRFLAPLTQ